MARETGKELEGCGSAIDKADLVESRESAQGVYKGWLCTEQWIWLHDAYVCEIDSIGEDLRESFRAGVVVIDHGESACSCAICSQRAQLRDRVDPMGVHECAERGDLPWSVAEITPEYDFGYESRDSISIAIMTRQHESERVAGREEREQVVEDIVVEGAEQVERGGAYRSVRRRLQTFPCPYANGVSSKRITTGNQIRYAGKCTDSIAASPLQGKAQPCTAGSQPKSFLAGFGGHGLHPTLVSVGFMHHPYLEPDENWKQQTRKEIERELWPLVEEARARCTHLSQYSPDSVAMRVMTKQYEQTMTYICNMAETTYRERLARERESRKSSPYAYMNEHDLTQYLRETRNVLDAMLATPRFAERVSSSVTSPEQAQEAAITGWHRDPVAFATNIRSAPPRERGQAVDDDPADLYKWRLLSTMRGPHRDQRSWAYHTIGESRKRSTQVEANVSRADIDGEGSSQDVGMRRSRNVPGVPEDVSSTTSANLGSTIDFEGEQGRRVRLDEKASHRLRQELGGKADRGAYREVEEVLDMKTDAEQMEDLMDKQRELRVKVKRLKGEKLTLLSREQAIRAAQTIGDGETKFRISAKIIDRVSEIKGNSGQARYLVGLLDSNLLVSGPNGSPGRGGVKRNEGRSNPVSSQMQMQNGLRWHFNQSEI
ncbi:predicted protein [Postia placenta Mad-698-R]|uniref:Uncharacterized protein n=1 Tax=Postia placenta MAD-698-R-SB12 TaxID=670580 RepID=A0A1X6N405_9APHY|nr:hypothetical protein POSPLADRAFT_1065643 [Postia placenta MAD-698-R-SB12]EED85903.1 predicted protein [Postia placenta Mad-698-R]OSX63206.1 hypothetical protein POSPLADRAFT_1065643 [Postia placenta MAD-698-R-SB12]